MKRAGAVALCLLVAVLGCSVVDGDDRDDLTHQIQSLPGDVYRGLAEWAAKEMVRKYLQSKPPNDELGKLECRYQYWNSYSGQWIQSKWQTPGDHIESPPFTVDTISKCLMGGDTYVACITSFLDALQISVAKHIQSHPMMPAMDIVRQFMVECRVHFYPHYAPDRVAAEARDADKEEPGDMERLGTLLTIDQIVNALIASPVPPPGVHLGPRILVLLCALGSDWGCPDTPGTTSSSAASSGGDWQ